MGIRDDRFWADFLGIEPTEWSSRGETVEPHAGLRGFCGLWCFRRNHRTVVSAPASWVPRLADVIAGQSDASLLLPAFWTQAFRDGSRPRSKRRAPPNNALLTRRAPFAT